MYCNWCYGAFTIVTNWKNFLLLWKYVLLYRAGDINAEGIIGPCADHYSKMRKLLLLVRGQVNLAAFNMRRMYFEVLSQGRINGHNILYKSAKFNQTWLILICWILLIYKVLYLINNLFALTTKCLIEST